MTELEFDDIVTIGLKMIIVAVFIRIAYEIITDK